MQETHSLNGRKYTVMISSARSYYINSIVYCQHTIFNLNRMLICRDCFACQFFQRTKTEIIAQ